MRILLAGHLDLEVAPSLGFTDSRALVGVESVSTDEALSQLADGLTTDQPAVEVEALAWGPGPTVVSSLEAQLPDWCLVSVARDGQGWTERGGTGPLLIEMGHDQGHDEGVRVMEKLGLRESRSLQRQTVVATSTSRSLLGPGGTATLMPDLSLREAGGSTLLTSRHAYLPGSGAGGGAAARLAELGAELMPTGEILAQNLHLTHRLLGVDLVVVLHPFWHAPDLVDAPEMVVVEAAGELGVPVVGVGISCSLSAPEMADAGVSGVHLRRAPGSFVDLGRRVAQTWLTNFAR